MNNKLRKLLNNENRETYFLYAYRHYKHQIEVFYLDNDVRFSVSWRNGSTTESGKACSFYDSDIFSNNEATRQRIRKAMGNIKSKIYRELKSDFLEVYKSFDW